MQAFLYIVGHLSAGLVKALFGCGVVCLVAFGGWKLLENTVAPDVEKFLSVNFPSSNLLLDKNGQLLYEQYADNKRREVSLSEISPYLIDATLVAEDKDYFEHAGVWLPGIFRALLVDTASLEASQGGSTITQQLVKNVILKKDKTLRRKIAEIVWAVSLESKLSKEEILEKYLGLLPYGRNSAGAESASLSFFGKSAKHLSLKEAVYLASLPKAPGFLSPDSVNLPYLEARANYILELLLKNQKITEVEFKSAQAEQISFIQRKDIIKAPHFVFLAMQEAEKIIGGKEVWQKGGFTVTTSLDLDLQTIGEKTVVEHLQQNQKKLGAHNAGLVAIQTSTGEILALVGSMNYFGESYPTGCISGKTCLFDPKTNTAVALRQTGSSFKPYVYVTALGEEFKMTPASKISDKPKTFYSAKGSYSPSNYTGMSYGNISLRKALGGSLNIATVNLLSQIGTEPVIQTTRNLGITAPLQNCGLALALGACEMSLLEHTTGFAGLLNLGNYNQKTAILKIEKQHQKVYEYSPKPKQAVHPAAAYELIDILSDNSARSYIFGKKSPLAFEDRQVAVKTGTTQNWKDGWTVGGTPQITIGVWVGNNNSKPMRPGADSIVTAAPLWRKFLEESLKDTAPTNFEIPFGISLVSLDANGKVNKNKTDKKIGLEPIADFALKVELPKTPKPKVASAKRPIVPGLAEGVDQEATVILEPWANQVIYQTPFSVSVHTGSTTEGTTVKLYLDEVLIAEKSSPPFLFSIPQKLDNGWHTLTATATHFDLLESSHTIKFRTHFNPLPIKPRGE